jgi:hypothetical protein
VSTMNWGVTPQHVKDKTDIEVDVIDVSMAVSTVEIYSNRTEAVSGNISARDLHWIRTAILWQAAWLIQQPDYTGRQNANQIHQDGVLVNYGPIPSVEGREYAITLAPLAARAIKNLSWKASRSIRTRRERRVFDAARFLLDDDHKWGIL